MRSLTVSDTQLSFTLRLFTALGLEITGLAATENGFSMSVSGSVKELPVVEEVKEESAE